MPHTNNKRSKKQVVHRPNARKVRRQTEAEQIRSLNERTKDVDALVAEKAESFSQLPISSKTLEALDKAGFVQLTDIQRDAVPRALCGRDVLGAAKTGSGKTLAFIIPILERLYRVDWSSDDGLGALVISPTRELALQIFQVLRSVGAQHSFSAGLIIGGKDVKIEKDRVHRMNILICTPGRLLQHMDETPGFDCSNLQILVLDEADRILDMGFAKTVNAIVENLPRSRQTLLFSATQTKSVKDLARLSLKDPDYVAVHEKADSATPSQLMQTYVVCELSEKLDLLWSFIRTHTQHKTVVFVSSCKQVRFIYETFRRMRAGMTTLQLYGKQKQHARMTAYDSFTKAKSAIMFATDIAARGLDFPAVDWVVQLDCPEDIDTYIHRVGRTARYQRGGSALMFLCPSEEAGMLQVLENKKVPIKKIQINPSKTVKVRGQLQALCSQFPELKYLGQKAFVSYVRSIHLQANKAVFDVNALPLDEFAESLGLPGSPKIKFIQKSQAKNDRRGPQLSDAAAMAALQELGMSDGEDSESEEEVKESQPRTRVERMFGRKNQDVLSEHYNKLIDRTESTPQEDKLLGGTGDDDDDGPDDFLYVQRRNHELVDEIDNMKMVPTESLSHRRLLREREKARKQLGNPNKVHFDEEGNAVALYSVEDEEQYRKTHDVDEERQMYMTEQAQDMAVVDTQDKMTHKERLRAKRREQKRKDKLRKQGILDPNGVQLADSEGVTLDSDPQSDNGEELGKRKRDTSASASEPESEAESDQDDDEHVSKDRRLNDMLSRADLEDQEALALRLLQGA
ncbi:ATP-dependent RNA helicase dbp4 [Sorochytrium milnesiophthora]